MNMEPKNHPFERKIIFSTSIIVLHVNFPGCYWNILRRLPRDKCCELPRWAQSSGRSFQLLGTAPFWNPERHQKRSLTKTKTCNMCIYIYHLIFAWYTILANGNPFVVIKWYQYHYIQLLCTTVSLIFTNNYSWFMVHGSQKAAYHPPGM